jgi:hypothetical protein
MIELSFNDVNESLTQTLLSPTDNVQPYNGTIVYYEEVSKSSSLFHNTLMKHLITSMVTIFEEGMAKFKFDIF